MLEMRITIAAPELTDAINNLAAALGGKVPNTVCCQYGSDNNHIDNTGTINFGTRAEAQTAPQNAEPATVPVDNPTAKAPAQTLPQAVPPAPVNPTSAVPVGAPLSVTPARTVAPAANPAPASAVPTSGPQYTLDMLARAGTALVDAGKMDALCGLLAKYNVEALTSLDPSLYGVFASELRALGAQI